MQLVHSCHLLPAKQYLNMLYYVASLDHYPLLTDVDTMDRTSNLNKTSTASETIPSTLLQSDMELYGATWSNQIVLSDKPFLISLDLTE